MTELFFKQCRRYLSEDISLKDCAEPLQLVANTFLHRIREAYSHGFLVLKGKVNDLQSTVLERHLLSEFKRYIKTIIAEGSPDGPMFARTAAETLLSCLRELLEDQKKKEVNVGIVSGSSTGEMIEQLVQGRLWDEFMGGLNISLDKRINIMALNVTPVDGWELEGNANIAVLRLAVLLRDKLPEGEKRVMPYGLSATLVVSENELSREDNNPANKKVITLADPSRLKPGKKSKLDLIITGVGSPENSVFSRVIDEEGIKPAPEIVGDVAFAPVDKDGNEVTLTRTLLKKGRGKETKSKANSSADERCLIYSAIRLDTMRELVESEAAKVLLIARNRRKGKTVDKTDSILAAIKGRYVNILVTDSITSTQLRKH